MDEPHRLQKHRHSAFERYWSPTAANALTIFKGGRSLAPNKADTHSCLSPFTCRLGPCGSIHTSSLSRSHTLQRSECTCGFANEGATRSTTPTAGGSSLVRLPAPFSAASCSIGLKI